MIKVYKLNKRYNKHKRNEIHVLNDVSLEFANTGLVFLLGPSGSGKSTLLNAIGGLDKVDSGNIVIDDKTVNKYHFNKWDYLRNQHIGYIFQNYVLLPELSVYDNIAFALRLVGLNKVQADERIDYALKAVNMEKFKKRKVKNLSGGQQQRIAIARALVKSPDVIIADEPTGNLDANNTNQIMNIIKKISKNCLVLMVTHEQRLAQFYGDRIIEISDGAIVKDYQNSETKELAGTEDRTFYLQDLNSETLVDDNINIKYFYNEEKPSLKLNVIFKDNTFYVHSFDSKVKIKLLTKSDEIKVIDGKRVPITLDVVDEYNYTLDKVDVPKNRLSVISFKEAFKMAFSRLKGLKWFQKLFLSSFFLIAIMLVIAISSFLGTFKFNDKELIYEDRHNLNISSKQQLVINSDIVNQYLSAIDEHGIVEYNRTVLTFSVMANVYQQTKGETFMFNGTPVSIDQVNEKDLILGNMPQKATEIVLDKWVIDNLLNQSDAASAGLSNYKAFIDVPFYDGVHEVGKIVGIVDKDSPSMYLNNSLRLSYMLFSERAGEYLLEQIKYEGTLAKGEIIVHSTQGVSKGETLGFEGFVFTVKDVYDDKEIVKTIFNDEDLELIFMSSCLNNRQFNVYSTDKKATETYFKELGFEVYDSNMDSIRRHKLEHRQQFIDQMVFTLVVLASSLIFMYFIMRSSLFSRVYEVGVYRALGVTRRDIYKIFACEVTIISLFTSFVGWLITTIIIQESLKGFNFTVYIYYPLSISLLTLAFIYIVNLINGLLPIYGLLRKTPAQILTKYDI